MCDKYCMSDLANFIQSATQGDLERLKAILDTNPEFANQLDDSGATALHYAALNGHREIARFLVEHGAAVNRTDTRFGATPTGWAIEYLREIGGYLAIELDDLAYAIESGDTRWVARFLQRFPGLRQATTTTGRSFRQLAAESSNPEIVALFDAGAGSTR